MSQSTFSAGPQGFLTDDAPEGPGAGGPEGAPKRSGRLLQVVLGVLVLLALAAAAWFFLLRSDASTEPAATGPVTPSTASTTPGAEAPGEPSPEPLVPPVVLDPDVGIDPFKPLIFNAPVAEGAVTEAGASAAPSVAGAGTAGAATPAASPVAVAAKPVGTAQNVGSEYTVTVTAVNQNANEIIAATNQLNELPKGQFVLVDITAKYTGPDEGDVAADLSLTLDGADGRQYGESSCDAVAPMEPYDQPLLTTGGENSYKICLDVAVAALAGGELFVKADDSETRFYWKLQ